MTMKTNNSGIPSFINKRISVVLTVMGVLTWSASAAATENYVRFQIGFDQPDESTFTDRDCSNKGLYGCGEGTDGAPHRSLGEFEGMSMLGVGIGYVVSESVRVELALEIRNAFEFQGEANFLESGRQQSVSAELSSVTSMIRTYVDLPQLKLLKTRPLIPFIGAGIGATRTEIDETHMMFPRTTTVVPGRTGTEFTWMLTAGVGWSLQASTTLELAWRYTDFGKVRTGRGEGRVIWRDGSRQPLLLDLGETEAQLENHGLELSVRYTL